MAWSVVALGLLCGATHGPRRSEVARKLHQAEQLRASHERDRLEAAQALQAAQAQAQQISDKRVKAAMALHDAEQGVNAAAARLAEAEADEARAETALRQREAAFSSLVPLMLRMSRYPAETVLAVPAPPDRALQGLLLTGGIAVTLNREAAALRAQAAEAARLQQATRQQASMLSAERAREAAATAALDTAMAETREKISAAEADGEKEAALVASLATQAETLRGAIAAMDTARAAAAASAAHEASQADRHRQGGAAAAARARQMALSRPDVKGGPGRLVAPVAGPVLRAFGAPALDGPATGITYEAAASAYVSSPCTGRVAFAAPFRSYGQLIIVECGGGLDMVLAGLGQIDTAPGHAVRAGEPIGRMPEAGKTPGSGRQGLYVEVRAHGQPVNPAPFLKVNG